MIAAGYTLALKRADQAITAVFCAVLNCLVVIVDCILGWWSQQWPV